MAIGNGIQTNRKTLVEHQGHQGWGLMKLDIRPLSKRVKGEVAPTN